MNNDAFASVLGAPEQFNSNNPWGFGGGIGLRYSRGSVVVKVFKACCRHVAPVKAVTVSVGGRRIYDEVQSRKSLARALDIATLELSKV